MKIEGISSDYPTIESNKASIDGAKDADFQASLEKAFDEKDDKKLREACRNFEAIFMNMMYKQMRATIQKSDLLPDDNATEVYQSMLDEEIVSEASKGRGMGLGEMLYKQLSKDMTNMYKLTK